MQIMREIASFSGRVYTPGTNFTRPPVVTIATNLNSVLVLNNNSAEVPLLAYLSKFQFRVDKENKRKKTLESCQRFQKSLFSYMTYDTYDTTFLYSIFNWFFALSFSSQVHLGVQPLVSVDLCVRLLDYRTPSRLFRLGIIVVTRQRDKVADTHAALFLRHD